MANPLLYKPILLLDGGLGTTLEDAHGIRFSSTTPLWSSHLLVDGVETLKTVQRDFAEAGADIILTATYQASFHGFKNTRTTNEDGIEREDAKRYMLSAVRIAREAFNGRPGLVALSLGAYGATMVPSTEYTGEYPDMTEDDLLSFHLERILTFVDSQEWKDVDLVAIETLPRIDEVRAARRVMQRVRDKEYWISCVFPHSREELPDGTGVEELVRTVLEGERSPYAIGINCTKVSKVASLIKRFEAAADMHGLDLPRLVIYPDGAGEKVYDTKLQQWVGDDEGQLRWDQQVYSIVKEVKDRGKWKGILVGGCCKTRPGHIKKLATRLQELR
ncbi:uncharacterized protein Z520_03625 [Fonsecaea multimorphosa CBS 102226]|uniref:Hcy-binding domain-containing protein n=1 Tax=Fonsecaea multimorphosa CBS 102226 TaxID=1442371 RepID=A0A0D2KW43_9EURO|nr:uncharacterized protein Z520_03625 [Fonsecaea multimorphosa CBS 102226]KIY00959.1 hypothetical protein Z520_03625 [Fonsecaea multimorphosa CBS 102226]OAL27543.1 hypothetical protein AYO22_03447 [Fonsecaea multimorphosa]